MSQQHETTKHENVTVKNVYCNNIRVSKCNTNDNYIATFNFGVDTDLHELLLHEVRKQYSERSCTVSNRAATVTCDPIIVGKDTYVIDTQPADSSAMNTTDRRRYSGATLSMARLNDVAHRRPVLMSRVDITFRDVLTYKDQSIEETMWLVEYSSFDTEVVSRMRTRVFTHS